MTAKPGHAPTTLRTRPQPATVPVGGRYRWTTMSRARMSPAPMVHVRTVPTPFHARVIAARLGAEGIPTQLRGNVGGLYPIGNVSVWVAEADAEVASELLLADEIESAFDTHPDDEEPGPASRRVLFGMTCRQLVASVGLVLIILGAGFSHLNVL